MSRLWGSPSEGVACLSSLRYLLCRVQGENLLLCCAGVAEYVASSLSDQADMLKLVPQVVVWEVHVDTSDLRDVKLIPSLLYNLYTVCMLLTIISISGNCKSRSVLR